MLPLSKNELQQIGGFFSQEQRMKNAVATSVEATRQLQQQVMALEPTANIHEEEGSRTGLPHI